MLRAVLVLLCALAAPTFAAEAVTQKPEVQPANAPGAAQKPDAFNVRPGFQVEKVFNVPRNRFGSWVCLTVDPKGRLIASDQGGQRRGDLLDPSRERRGLYRITPPRPGTDDVTRVEPLDVEITGAQGLLFAFIDRDDGSCCIHHEYGIGDKVEEGQIITIIEAMKMENEITAHKAGVVAELPIKEGEAVTAGALLAVIKSDGE